MFFFFGWNIALRRPMGKVSVMAKREELAIE
jgi:hypothetical protein